MFGMNNKQLFGVVLISLGVALGVNYVSMPKKASA